MNLQEMSNQELLNANFFLNMKDRMTAADYALSDAIYNELQSRKS